MSEKEQNSNRLSSDDGLSDETLVQPMKEISEDATDNYVEQSDKNTKKDYSGVLIIIAIIVTIILVMMVLDWLLSDYWPIIDGLWFFISVFFVILFVLKLIG